MTDKFIKWIEELPPGIHPINPWTVQKVKDYIDTTEWSGFIELNEAMTKIRKLDATFICEKEIPAYKVGIRQSEI